MERDELKRTEIEDRIITKASDMVIHERRDDGIYIDLARLDEFMDECHELVRYYRKHLDTVIGIEVVRVYADFTRNFTWLKSNTRDEKIRESSQEWLDSLEHWIDSIITEGARNWEALNPKE